jgi:hypothetical protein
LRALANVKFVLDIVLPVTQPSRFADYRGDRPADILADLPAPSPQVENQLPSPKSGHDPPDRLGQLWRWFAKLSLTKKAYLVSVVALVAWLLPNVLSIGLVGVERLLVGGIVLVEEAIVVSIRALGLYGLFAGMLVVVAYGVYTFYFDKKER